MRLLRTLITLSFLALLTLPSGVGRAQDAPSATNPHGTLRSSLDCSDCHTSAGWKPMRADANFEHSRDTRFALTGRHLIASCTRCHLDLRFDEPKSSESECSSCHVDVHRGNLAGDCVRCHNTSDFRDVEATSLHQRTGFPLIGAHVTAPCESCHKTERSGAYAAIPRECLACHRQSLAAAASAAVDHSAFPPDCSECHTPFSWSGGTVFDHALASAGFVLEGAHAVQRCVACHSVPGFALRFSPTPTNSSDCVACHQADYQREHGSAGYGTTCIDCHGPSSWASSFNHDGNFFPINSGAHRGEWDSCATCHTTPGDFQTFDCLSCHQQATMDNKHSERADYSYDSPSCYRCHPRGKH